WRAIGYTESVHHQQWPQYDPEALVEEQITIAVQINGKVRERITVPADADESALREAVLNDCRVQEIIKGRQLIKAVAVPRKLVSLVIR
ncbi:MAG: class I tRNA ligase family protein, partial [Syntrophomonadaceae bacterium]|nr:class I tRNA ligase family protein [Syntrophomonadaceae bacterium]